MRELKKPEQKENETKKYSLYVHINKANQKKYVGVTKNHPKKRWKTNGQGYKNQNYFYNAIQKYGWNNFEHIIIQDNLSKNEAFKLEKEYIQRYNSNNSDFGYNICSGGIGGCGLSGKLNSMYGVSVRDRMDAETYERWLYLHQTQEHNELCKKIICLTTMETFKSAKMAGDIYDIQHGDISNCCNNKLYSAGKHPETNEEMVWQYYEDYISGVRKPIKETISVYCVTTQEKFDRAVDAAKKYHINQSGITLCCQGKRRYCGVLNGQVMQWVYYTDFTKNKEIHIFDKRVICLNTLKMYKNIKEAEKDTGIISSNISQCCRGKTSYAGIINGEKIVWQMYTNYISGNLLLHKNKKEKMVICETDGKHFSSTKEATLLYQIKRKNSVAECCRGIRKYVYDSNKNKLTFRYI
ncbi:GIY-YIG nuclease family protein [Lacrimispora indolis]|uniref:GIY-YIG nuclease family protein n=1 Tax=Lacrimispora indolis TaxID=69825 RepID=UPI000412123C|nr:GIY-YIG nuclease family protein [[Clostridium] methoxybenzovorans]